MESDDDSLFGDMPSEEETVGIPESFLKMVKNADLPVSKTQMAEVVKSSEEPGGSSLQKAKSGRVTKKPSLVKKISGKKIDDKAEVGHLDLLIVNDEDFIGWEEGEEI
jgi:hypothetical protein